MLLPLPSRMPLLRHERYAFRQRCCYYAIADAIADSLRCHISALLPARLIIFITLVAMPAISPLFRYFAIDARF